MGRGRGAVEKPQDFGGVMKKLVHFCRHYIPAIIVALVLGAIGTVCQIVGPDKLKDNDQRDRQRPACASQWQAGARCDRHGRGHAHRMAAGGAVCGVRGAVLRAKLDDGERYAAHRTGAARSHSA